MGISSAPSHAHPVTRARVPLLGNETSSLSALPASVNLSEQRRVNLSDRHRCFPRHGSYTPSTMPNRSRKNRMP